LDAIAEVVKPAYETLGGLGLIGPIEVVGAQVSIVDIIAEDVVASVNMEAATAMIAFLGPRRLLMRRN